MKKEVTEVSEVEEPSPMEEESFVRKTADQSMVDKGSKEDTSKRSQKKFHSARRSVVSQLVRDENESIRCWNQRQNYKGVPFLNITSPRFQQGKDM